MCGIHDALLDSSEDQGAWPMAGIRGYRSGLMTYELDRRPLAAARNSSWSVYKSFERYARRSRLSTLPGPFRTPARPHSSVKREHRDATPKAHEGHPSRTLVVSPLFTWSLLVRALRPNFTLLRCGHTLDTWRFALPSIVRVGGTEYGILYVPGTSTIRWTARWWNSCMASSVPAFT